MAPKIIPLRDHPYNSDKSSVFVGFRDASGHSCPAAAALLYLAKTDSGFVVGSFRGEDFLCVDGLFPTDQAATAAGVDAFACQQKAA